MASRVIKAILKADDKASPAFVRLGNAIKVVGTIAATVGAIQLGRKLVRGIEESVDAATVQQDAEVKLAQSIRLTGKSVAQTLPELKAQAAALQDLTAVGDEVILSNQSLLISLGKLEGEGLKRATKAALDMGAHTGNAAQAFDLIAKAATGYTSTLSRYGIFVDASLSKSERFEQALQAIEAQFGGQAEARLHSYSGRLDELAGRWGDLQEQIGGVITNSPEVQRLLMAVSDAIKGLTSDLENLDTAGPIGTAIKTLGFLSKGLITISTTATNAALAYKLLGQAITSTPFTPPPDYQSTLDQIQEVYNTAERLKSEIDNIVLFSVTPPKIDAAGTHDEFQRQINSLPRTKVPVVAAPPDTGDEFLANFEIPPVELDWKPKPLPGQTEVRVPVTLEPQPVDRDKFLTPLQQLAQDYKIDLGLVDQVEELGIAIQSVSLQPITDETLQVKNALGEMATQVLDQIAPGFRSIAEDDVTAISDALAVLNESGVAGLIEYVKSAKDEAKDLAETLKYGLGEIAVRGAMKLGDTLVDAAFGAEASFGEFAKSMLKQIASMIAQALILKAILSATGGPAGFFGSILGFAGGGIVPVPHAQHGLIVRGGLQGRDTVPILAQAKEGVLPVELTDMLVRDSRDKRDRRPSRQDEIRREREGRPQTINVFLVDQQMSQADFRRMLEDDPDGFVSAAQIAARVRAF